MLYTSQEFEKLLTLILESRDTEGMAIENDAQHERIGCGCYRALPVTTEE